MNDLVLQSGTTPSVGEPHLSVALLLMVIIPALMIIAGTVMGFRALRDIRVAEGALGGPVLATFAAGLVGAILIVIVCGAGLTMLAEEVVRGPRSRSDVWAVAGGAVGVLLGLGGALPRAAYQDHVLIEVRQDLVAVLAQQVERDVVGTGHVKRVVLPRRADVQNAWWRRGVHKNPQLSWGNRGRRAHYCSSISIPRGVYMIPF